MHLQRVQTCLHFLSRAGLTLIIAITVLIGLGFATTHAHAQQGAGSVLNSNPNLDSGYARVARFSNGTLLSTFQLGVDPANQVWTFYKSTDNGASWSVQSTLDTGASSGSCCESLYISTQQVGSYPAGTAFFAATVHPDNNVVSSWTTYVYESSDAGDHWTFLSSTFGGGKTWEPELGVDASGHLILFASDEREQSSGYNQFIGEEISTDGGQTWGSETKVVAVNDGFKRPGMPRLARLNNGKYMLAYEVVNGDPGSALHVRYSDDGDNWGDPTDLGTFVTDNQGRWFFATSMIANVNGKVVVGGQVLKNSFNSDDANSGKVFFINSQSDGKGTWSDIASPFAVNNTEGGNYSPVILPSTDGNSILYMAGSYNTSTGHTDLRYATGPLNHVDLAKGKPVQVSGTFQPRVSSYLVDGDPSTFWASQGSNTSASEAWASVDLGNTTVYNRVVLYPRVENGVVYCFPSDFKIQGSNNQTDWTTLTAVSGLPNPSPDSSGLVFTLGTQTYRYLRIDATSLRADDYGAYYLELGGIEVYEDAASSQSTITTSSSIYSYYGSNLSDTDTSTFWSSQQDDGNANASEWAYIDLGSQTSFTHVFVYPRVLNGSVTCFPATFKIQGSNDPSSGWTDLLSRSNFATPTSTAAGVAFYTGAQSYRYVRFYGSNFQTDPYGDAYLQLSELEVG